MLDLGLERGINLGAHFIEVYPSDMDDPASASVLLAYGAIMTTAQPVPNAPSSLTATVTSLSHIDLAWIDNANNEYGQTIEQSVGTNSSYVVLKSLDANVTTQVGANVQSYSDTTRLEPNTNYYYRIRGTNGTLNSDYSNEPSAKTFR